LSEALDDFLGSSNYRKPASGERVQLLRGLAVRQNVMNPFVVVSLRYEAQPNRDPLTEEGRAWAVSEMRDMGCRRVCRDCDKVWGVEDELCPECSQETELILSNRWKREYEIDYSAHSGSYVFESFSKARNTCKPFRIPSGWRRYRLVDHGVRNPTACLWIAVDPDGAAWVYAEHYEAGMPVPHHAKEIHRIGVEKDHHALELSHTALNEMELTNWSPTKDFIRRTSKLYKTLGDPSMNNRTQADMATVKQRYGEYGIYIGDANRESPGLETINHMFSEGTLTLFDTCVNTMREVEGLVWEEHQDPSKNKKEREVDKDNHTTDCLKYFANDFAPAAKEIERQMGKPVTGEERAIAHRNEFHNQFKSTGKPFHFTDL
jgi:hypothetical protein